MVRYTLEERRQRCLSLRKKGYNCAQAIAMVFDDVTGIDNAVMERLSAPLGGGIGGRGMTCGCVTAMAIVKGALAYSGPSAKASLYQGVASMVDDFEARNGSCDCRELKKSHPESCNDLILDTIETMHHSLCDNN